MLLSHLQQPKSTTTTLTPIERLKQRIQDAKDQRKHTRQQVALAQPTPKTTPEPDPFPGLEDERTEVMSDSEYEYYADMLECIYVKVAPYKLKNVDRLLDEWFGA